MTTRGAAWYREQKQKYEITVTFTVPTEPVPANNSHVLALLRNENNSFIRDSFKVLKVIEIRHENG